MAFIDADDVTPFCNIIVVLFESVNFVKGWQLRNGFYGDL